MGSNSVKNTVSFDIRENIIDVSNCCVNELNIETELNICLSPTCLTGFVDSSLGDGETY